jgi:hypothetical protein
MTDRTPDIATLIAQLRILGQLTRTEAQVARLRVAQASTDAVRAELRQNAADADGRAARIAAALRDLGALPDPVTPLLGRVAALVRGALEQAQPLDEAVLGDLTLEHQLRDRSRYVAALAGAADRTDVRELADDLVAAHTETVDWLSGVLADLGTGTPAALGASPLQQVAAQVTHVANAPARPSLDKVGAGVARTVQAATEAAGAARDTAGTAVDKVTAATGQTAGDLAQGAAAAAGAVRQTAAQTLETVTGATGKAVTGAVGGAAAAADVVRDTTAHALDRTADTAAEAATATAETAQNLTAAADEATTVAAEATAATEAATEAASPRNPDEPPIPGFADLPAHAAVAALRALDDSRDVEAVLEFEQAHGNRSPVLEAARLRVAALRSG